MASSLKFSDRMFLEGNFEVYGMAYDKTETLLFEDHNQIQQLGINVLARLLCLGMYGKDKPIFTNIKASTRQETSLSNLEMLLPGDPFFPGTIVEADSFLAEASTNLFKDQYVKNTGIFLNPPPTGVNAYGKTVAAFHHFGLYLSAYTDIEEYLFAYKYTESGFSYPEGFGLKIIWTITFRS